VIASLTIPQQGHEVTRKVAAAVRDRINNPLPKHAAIRGIHAEGPIIHTKGGLPDSAIGMSNDDFRQLLSDLAPVKIMTISPTLEYKRSLQRMEILLQSGVRVSLGHDSDATEESLLACLTLGQKYGQQMHVTHIFNASAFHHRAVGLVNFALLDKFPRLLGYEGLQPPTAEIIGDFVHVHALALAVAIKTKGPEQLAVITDAIIDSDTHGDIHYCGKSINVQSISSAKSFPAERKAAVTQNGTIAGSCTSQLQMFQDLVKVLDVPLLDAATMLSETPARISGCVDQVGTLQVGKAADILVFDKDLNLQCVVVRGEILPIDQTK
jgi:N-acetylglucosamine-6-phosphate deacetylase